MWAARSVGEAGVGMRWTSRARGWQHDRQVRRRRGRGERGHLVGVRSRAPAHHERPAGAINLAVAFVEHDGYKVNLLDTPGFFHFAGQVNSALAAGESSLVVVSANSQLAVGAAPRRESAPSNYLPREQLPRVDVVHAAEAAFEAQAAPAPYWRQPDHGPGVSRLQPPRRLFGLAQRRLEGIEDACPLPYTQGNELDESSPSMGTQHASAVGERLDYQ